MDADRLASWRFDTVGLTGQRFTSAEEVVGWFGAVQAQEYGPAKRAVGQRTDGLTDGDIDHAMAAGSVLRTHILRPTWHFVLPEDISWMLRLTGPRVHALNAYHYRQAGLDAAVLDSAASLITEALAGGNWLSRKEVAVVLDSGGITASGFRLAYILMHAELEGLICSGGLKGKQHTYALLSERAPDARRLSSDDALAELVLRYFTSHGPATVKDLSWWSSMTIADLNAGLEMVRRRLDSTVVDGVTYWWAPPHPPAQPSVPSVRLLQGYDEYIVGYSQSKFLLNLGDVVGSSATERALYNGVAVIGTQVAGHWKRTLNRNEVVVDVTLYKPLGDAEVRALQAEADALGAFVGRKAVVVTAQL